MRNPMKKMAKGIGNLFGRQPKGRPDVSLYAELEKIWPAGTGASFGFHNLDTASKDHLAQCTLLDCWAYEEYKEACDRAGYELNPGHFGTYPSPIPSGWSPSEKGLKALFAKKNWSTEFMHLMVGQLKHLGRLRP